MTFGRTVWLPSTIVWLTGLFLAGCIGGGAVPGTKISYQDDFFPSEWHDRDIVWRVANIDVDAEAELQIEGHERVIQIISGGVIVEEERYRVTTEGIWLVNLGPGDTFHEPLTLMQFPMEVGEKLSWSGAIGFGERQVPATAETSSRRDSISLATGHAEAVHLQVDLTIDDGSPNPPTRRLDFWFVKGKGPVKRDFGNQVREPRIAPVEAEQEED